MTQVSYAFTLFFSLLLETAPFLLLGVIVSSALLVFIDQNQWQSRFPKNPILGTFFGSGLGLLFPLGQYGIIPIARRFLLQGISLPIVISFLIAAPTINPIVLWISWRVFSFQGHLNLFYWRIILTVAIALIVGCLFAFSTPAEKPQTETESQNALVTTQIKPKLKPKFPIVYTGSSLLFPLAYQPLLALGKIIYDDRHRDGVDLPRKEQWRVFQENLTRELLEWGSLLILGCTIATIVQIFLPQGKILALGISPTEQIIFLSLFGVILSLGTMKNSLFATTLLSTFSSSSILGFLLMGSILDIKTLTFIFGSFGLKVSLYFVIITVQLILLISLLFDFYGTSLL